MIQKLLLSVRSVFLKFSDPQARKTSNPVIKLACLGMFLVMNLGYGQTVTWDGWSGDGNWNTPTNWSTNSVPTIANDVIIPNGSSAILRTVNINTAAVCKSLTINGGGSSNSTTAVTITGSNSLTVSGAVTIAAVTVDGITKYINAAAGSLSCASFTMQSSGGTNRRSSLRLSSGTIEVSGNIAMNSTNNDVTFSGSGLLKVGGSMTSGTLTPSTGTVEYNNSGAQNIGNYPFYNLTLSGNSGATKAFSSSGIITSNILTIGNDIVANLSTVTHTAKTLILGGINRPSGTWGSSSSNATNINDLYFSAATGIISVTACTAPTAFNVTGTGGAFCSSNAGSSISLSNSQATCRYQLVRGNVAVGSPITGTGAAINFGTFNTTGSYTVIATNTTSLCSAVMTGSVNIYRYSSPPVPTATVVNVSCPGEATGSITVTNAVAPASANFVSANNQGINLNASLLSNRAAFTLEGWIKFDKNNYIARMALFGQNDIIEVGFEGNNLRFWTSRGTVDLPLSSFPAGYTWNHVAVTADGSSMKIYLNGGTPVSTAVNTTNYGSNSNTTKMGYGVMDDAGVGLTGEIFKLGVWNRALTPAEIGVLASGFVDYDASQNGLLAGYSFNEGTGSTLYGVGSAATNGTLMGSPSPVWTDPYTYSWTSTPPGFTSSSKNLTGLTNRTYNLVTSLTTCTNSGSWTVNATNLTTAITTQPSAATTCVGNNAAFSVAGTGTSLTYKWQVSTNSGSTFSDLSNGGVYSNVTSATMNITSAIATMNNYQYRCIVGGACPSVTSNAVTLTVNSAMPAPVVGTVTQPTCTVTFGSIALSGLPSGGTLTRSPGAVAVPYTGTTVTDTNLAAGTYSYAVANGPCSSISTTGIVINPVPTATYGASGWDNTATIDKKLIFNSNFTSIGDVSGCTCEVNSGANVVIGVGHTLKIANEVKVLSGGTMTFKNTASLVQTNNVTNTGDITYERTTPPILLKDYVYWSTPVSPQRLVDLSSLTPSTMYYGFDGTQWVRTNRTDNMVVGKGYIIRAPSNYSNSSKTAYPASFKGVPNNGNIETEMLASGKSYLIGNPYPSALSAERFVSEGIEGFIKTNENVINGTLYFWTHNTPAKPVPSNQYSADDYASFNLTGGTAARSDVDFGSGGGVKPTGEIAAGQSFFLTTKAAGKILFTNAMRLGATDNGQFFRPANTSRRTTVEKNRIWLNMTSTTGAFKQLLLGYIEGATNNYETLYDGLSLDGNQYLDFYSVSDANKFVIQGRAVPFTDADIVPLGYRTAVAGDFTIAIDEVDGKMTNQKIYVEDKVTGVIHDLTQSNYTFKTEVGNFSERLVLRYTGKTLGVGDFENLKDGILVSIKDKVIAVQSSQENIKEVIVYDVSGKMLYHKKKVGNTELQIQNLPSSNQVLLVKVTLANDFTTTRKVIFQ
ncbi:LamG-like jellyroll fold domain-containing protein [Flavobacterium lipolyticum]|uniref:T9SS sorting signal type C domain-containing protein n=1 Tax=Flavobacterium lipolyticum TaxID=2893754 RepID=A0ABS8LZU1_9FLAO|nr:LamG-like jellyroll fold domain-containing protein [Flavobacterium sp. F-126]MCC9017582.1 T9SS sorting signal type C domain-containing protein [Flavobacterium sp. F-126]